MPGLIKYSTSSVDGALRKGNTVVGMGEVPTSAAANMAPGIDIPSGGYVVYTIGLNNTPKMWVADSESELLPIARTLGGNPTTVEDAKYYICSVTDAWILDNPINDIVDDGLVLALDADNLSSYPEINTSFMDLSGEGNDGTLINGPTFNSNGYLDFDGTDDSVVIPNSTTNNINDNFTFSILVKSSTWTSGNQEGLVQKGAISNYGAYLRGGGGTVSFYTSPTSYWAPGPDIGGDGRWHLLTFVYSYSQLGYKQVYVDGLYHSQLAVTVPITSNTSDIQIGFAGVGAPKYLNAGVANYKLYNKVLTSPEILQNYYQAPIVTDGLVFAVDAGNLVSYESGDTTTYSLTGSVNGTLTNGVGFNNANGGTWEFDGTNDYITLDDNLVSAVGGIGTSTEYTLEAWIYVQTSSGTTTNSDNIIGHTSATGFGMQVGVSNSKPRINYGARSTSNFYSSTFEYNEWVHVVLSRRSTSPECQTYLNGVLDVSSGSNLDIISPADGDLNIGGGGGRVSGYFDGSMGPIRVYSKALTSAEVAQNYNAQRSRFSS